MAVDGKNKGNSFERQVYHILVDKFGKTNIKRSLGSGSSVEPGDIQVVIDNTVFYALDTKFYAKLTWVEIIKMFEKLEAEVSSKGYTEYIPVLVVRQNGVKDWDCVFRSPMEHFIVRIRWQDWLRFNGAQP